MLPTLALTSSAAAVSIGFINMSANIPGYVSNRVMGNMKDSGYDESACMLFLSAGFVVGALLVSMVRIRVKRSTDAP